MGSFVDLKGQTFDRLTVIGRLQRKDYPRKSKSVMWRCLCTCGEWTIPGTEEFPFLYVRFWKEANPDLREFVLKSMNGE